MVPGVSASTPTGFLPEGPFLDLLAVSLTGVNVLYPVYETTSELVDFAIEYLNPAGQRMTGLAERPGGTLLTRFPHAIAAGIFAYYQRVYTAGATDVHEVNYQADGLDNFFRLAARRSGEWLVVSFTDTSDQNRSAVEEALRQSQAAEQAARAEAEAQRQRFYEVLLALPAQIATYHGPDHVYHFVNARYQQCFAPQTLLLGRSVRETNPEVGEQGIFALMDRVYQTGEPFQGRELEVWVDFTGTGQRAQVFLNVCLYPLRDAQGRLDGLLDFSYDVTEQVRARQQLEQLNQELESRVQERTQATQVALGTAEREHNLLQAVLTQAPVAIGLFQGEELRITAANAQLAAIWGRTPEQVLGQPLLDAVPELRGQGFDEQLRQVQRTQVLVRGTETPAALLRDGHLQTTYYNFVYQPLYDAEGRVLGVIDVAVEVTEQVVARQQAERLQADLLAAARRQVEERETFYQVFEQVPAAVALLRSPGHRFEYVNPTYQQLFAGRPLVGLDYATALPEAAAQGFVALLDQVYQTEETFFGNELPFTPTPAEGQLPRTSYFSFTFQAYREAGQVAGISIFAFDVTEQVLARHEREAQQQLLTSVFEQAPAGIWVVQGPDYVFEFVNPLMEQILGQSQPQLLGRPYFEVLPELTSQGLPELFGRVWEQGETVFVAELAATLAYHAPGEVGYFTFVFQPLPDEHGQVARISCVALDVTTQVQARQQVQDLNEELAAINEELTATNEELNESNTQLTRTNVDLDTFVYTASHDLKAPITNIESIVLALRDTLPTAVQQDEVVAHLLALLDTTVARFRLTIGQLTDISKLQLAHAGPAEPVRLAQAIENVRLDLVPALAAADTQLSVEVDPELVVSFSPSNLRSIVYNLLSNAIKYRAPDRPAQVRVHAAQIASRVALIVQDNGLGMSEVQQRQLFGLFQRLHTHVEGTGVGLYITKRLVENAGGTITVQSQPGTGTTFTVTFPA